MVDKIHDQSNSNECSSAFPVFLEVLEVSCIPNSTPHSAPNVMPAGYNKMPKLRLPTNSLFRPEYPIRKTVRNKPKITPLLRKQFDGFISKFDLTKNGRYTIPLECDMKMYAVVEPHPIIGKPDVFIGIHKKPHETYLVILRASVEGKLKEITDQSSFVPGMTGELMSVIFERAGDVLPMKEGLKEALDLPRLSKEAKKQAMESLALNEKMAREKNDEINSIKPEKTRSRRWFRDPVSAIEVLQRGYAITNPKNERFIETFGAGPCYILTLYDPRTKTGVMAHIDAMTDVSSSLGRIVSQLQGKGVETTNIEARLVGGDNSSKENLLDILGVLEREKIKIVEKDVIRDNPAAIVLDTETGEIYDYSETVTITDSQKMKLLPLVIQMGGPLRKNKRSL